MEKKNLSFMGYPQYSVDTDGNVYSNKFGKVRKLKGISDNDGYSCVGLCNNGIRKTFKVHRLVAMAFIPNPDNKQCIDHINTNRSDNRVCNLRWVTSKENSNNPITCSHISEAMKGKYCGASHPMFGKHHTNEAKRKLSKTVLQYDKDGQFIAEYYGASEAQRLTNIADSNINACCRGKLRTAGGFVWKYKEESE